MNISVDKKGTVTLITLTGKIDSSNSKDLKTKFSQLRASPDNYVMDFKDVEFIDSSGLGAFVACLKSALETGGNIKIANLQKKVRMVFEITRIHKICDIFDSVDAALASYSRA